MNRLLRVRTGKQPHEVAILIISIVIGVVGSFGPERISNAIAETFTPPWAAVFWAGLAVFGAVALWGVFAPKIEGLLTERIGLIALALFYAAFAGTIMLYSGKSGLLSTALPLAFCAGNIGRAIQIRKDLKLLTDYLRDHPNEIVR